MRWLRRILSAIGRLITSRECREPHPRIHPLLPEHKCMLDRGHRGHHCSQFGYVWGSHAHHE